MTTASLTQNPLQSELICPKQTIRDITDWQGVRAFVRVDFNTPQDPATGAITDDSRIRATLQTLQYLQSRGARLILASHLGRPKGKVDPKYSLAPVIERLRALMPGVSILAAPSVVGASVAAMAEALKPGEILVLENLRFEAAEEANDPAFAKQLGQLADIFVNDAFGAAHRAHASTTGIAEFTSRHVAGLLMAAEIEALSQVTYHPKRPMTAIIGGSKISTKIGVLNQLIQTVDTLVIGGGMMFTFIKAQGGQIGNSLIEENWLQSAEQLLQQAKTLGKTIVLASDVVAADAFSAQAQTRICPANDIADGWMGLDIGPDSIHAIQSAIEASKTLLWNGPMGVFELAPFAEGTHAIAKTVADWTKNQQGISVLGGGDTVAAMEQFGFTPDQFSHVSTGGGASLEFLEGRVLPGIAVLDDVTSAVS